MLFYNHIQKVYWLNSGSIGAPKYALVLICLEFVKVSQPQQPLNITPSTGVSTSRTQKGKSILLQPFQALLSNLQRFVTTSLFSETTCPFPPRIINGIIVCGNAPQDVVKAGTTCTITCDAGHTLRGQNTTRCLKSGTWSSALPQCESKKYLNGYSYRRWYYSKFLMCMHSRVAFRRWPPLRLAEEAGKRTSVAREMLRRFQTPRRL